MFSLPVAGSRSTQRTCFPVDAQFIIGIVPPHSTGVKYIESSCINRWVTNGRSWVSNVRTSAWSGGWSTNRRYRSEEHTSELQSQSNLVCRLLLEKQK